MRGTPGLRAAWASALSATFMAGAGPLDPAHITCSAGAGAIIDMLFHAIGAEGEGVLIPAPYYPAFDNDLKAR